MPLGGDPEPLTITASRRNGDSSREESASYTCSYGDVDWWNLTRSRGANLSVSWSLSSAQSDVLPPSCRSKFTRNAACASGVANERAAPVTHTATCNGGSERQERSAPPDGRRSSTQSRTASSHGRSSVVGSWRTRCCSCSAGCCARRRETSRGTNSRRGARSRTGARSRVWAGSQVGAAGRPSTAGATRAGTRHGDERVAIKKRVTIHVKKN